MESSVVIVVGITVTLSSLLVKFQVRLTECVCTVELIAIKQTRSVASPIIPCKLFDLKKVLGESTTYAYIYTYVNTKLLYNTIVINIDTVFMHVFTTVKQIFIIYAYLCMYINTHVNFHVNLSYKS